VSKAIESKEFSGYEAGTLVPLMKCARCDSQARLIVEGLKRPSVPVCVDHALEICHELGDSLGAQLIAKKMSAL